LELADHAIPQEKLICHAVLRKGCICRENYVIILMEGRGTDHDRCDAMPGWVAADAPNVQAAAKLYEAIDLSE
jgi:hypothetical protein